MLYWLWMIILGLIIGVIAKLLMPGKDPGGFIVTALLGIAGMFVGGWLSGLIFGAPAAGFAPSGFIGGTIGALILLAIYRFATKPR
jgi:uncharacterized membrane protein YeaQ/YmgE (transglycosylase-associated protein family)